MKFATKLTASIIIVALIVVPLMGLVVFNSAKNIVQKNIIASQYELTQNTMDEIDRTLYGAYQDIQLIAGDLFLQKFIESHMQSDKASMDLDTKKLILAEMEEKLLLTGPWLRLMIFDINGFLFSSTLKKMVGNRIKDYPIS